MRGLQSRITAFFILLWADCFSHHILSLIPTNEAYLFVCVNFNLLALLFLIKTKPTKLMKDISLLALAQMGIQIVAWFVLKWPAYPYFSHDAITGIVALTYLRLLLIRKTDGDFKRYPRWVVFSRDYNLVHLFSERIS